MLQTAVFLLHVVVYPCAHAAPSVSRISRSARTSAVPRAHLWGSSAARAPMLRRFTREESALKKSIQLAPHVINHHSTRPTSLQVQNVGGQQWQKPAGRLWERVRRGLSKSTTTRPNALEGAASFKQEGNQVWKVYEATMSTVTNLFPLWTLLTAIVALKSPGSFAWFDTNWFTAGLGVLMLSMGITLTPADFMKVLTKPLPVAVGFASCYGLMPLIALGLAKAFSLSKPLTAGLVLCGSINGGQASNLCAYIAKGNVALSVMMTLATTVGAIFMTPLLAKLLLGTSVPVDAQGIAISTMQVVLFPLLFGMSLKQAIPKWVDAVIPITPVVGVIATCLLVGSAVAQVAPDILSAGLTLQWAAMLLHLLGGLAGYWVMRFLGQDEVTSRTSGIETSMKSSAFGFLLAKLHFGDYAARVPPAVSVVWMALIGASMAVVWRGMPVKDGNLGDDTTGALAEKPKEPEPQAS